MAVLRRLEYRGYDSAGLATSTGAVLHVRRCAGQVARLTELIARQPAPGCHGIGHTRWATHGGATDVNAHPHLGGDGQVAVVHNGVIENHAKLRRELQAAGYVFRSTTDSEVIAHLIASYLDDDLLAAVRQALDRLKGTYALAAMSLGSPGSIVAARLGSPLVIGIGEGESFLASDLAALAGYVTQAVFLDDGQLAVVTPGSCKVLDSARGVVDLPLYALNDDFGATDKGAFEHYMLKEIHEQPHVLARIVKSWGTDESLDHVLEDKNGALPRRVIMTACGTSYHAALLGKYLFEELAHIPVEVEYASELSSRRWATNRRALVVGISQSGETADTLAALRAAKRKGHATLALCNVPSSTLAREADRVIDLNAGPEISVASTKAFTAQVAVLATMSIRLARIRCGARRAAGSLFRALQQLPELVQQTLQCREAVRRVAEKYHQSRSMLYLGRHFHYPVALEGALKLKEVTYVHAEGHPAAEMKHGPIALVDEETPCLCLVPRSSDYEKTMTNLEEVRARGGPVIAVANDEDRDTAARADDVIFVPRAPDCLQPLVTIIPLQLLAYETALLRGCDVDRPRNLAKSVTVE
jgi:glutamine---fructose-6-phosphate transaminase (isomerizing)